jgi:hypothetical protein
LLDTYGQAELVVAGPPVRDAHALSHQIWHAIGEGERFAEGDRWRSPWGNVRFGEVHPIQYDLDTFNRWHLMADHGYLREPLRAIQVLVPASWKEPAPRWIEPDLSDAAARVDARRLNRAQRHRRGR